MAADPKKGAQERPLSALLSQVLVAYTVELDNQFELRMGAAGYPGARLSLVVWLSRMRFLADGDVSVRDLTARAKAPANQAKFQLGCLERWGFITLDGRGVLSDGWGSGRGIRSEHLVRLTEKGRRACEIWPPLIGEMEQRWKTRFGEPLDRLRLSLESVVRQMKVDLAGDSLPELLSQLLLQFTSEFDRESAAPLQLCATTLRVLGETPVPLSELPRLTGASPETSDIGWQARPYVLGEQDPARKRGKAVWLTPLGLSVQRRYHDLVREIEKRWEERFGKEEIRRVRESLGELFLLRRGDVLLLAETLIPPPGTVRAGDVAPALGRRVVGVAARQRMRDLVEQTALFARDPANALPHYPAWDMNRGFGP